MAIKFEDLSKKRTNWFSKYLWAKYWANSHIN